MKYEITDVTYLNGKWKYEEYYSICKSIIE